MKLIIENTLRENLKPFIKNFVIPAVTKVLYSIVDFKQLKTFDAYVNENYTKIFDTKQIIRLALSNLIIYDYRDNYELSINPNVFIPGTNAKLYDICALINYGNLEIVAYPIFDKIMEKLATLVPYLYQKYKLGV